MTWTKEKQREYMREYCRKNRDVLREKKKLQIAGNPEYAASLKRSKENWRKNNRSYANEYVKKRKAIDVAFKLRMYLRTRLYQAVKGGVKTGSAVEALGCSIEEFKTHIEAQFTAWMTWDNYGEWHLDHIKPLIKFDLSDPEQFKEACHYTNYQPLWAVQNIRKGGR